MSKLRPDPTQTLTDVQLPCVEPDEARRIRAALEYVEHISTEDLEMLVRVRRKSQHQDDAK